MSSWQLDFFIDSARALAHGYLGGVGAGGDDIHAGDYSVRVHFDSGEIVYCKLTGLIAFYLYAAAVNVDHRSGVSVDSSFLDARHIGSGIYCESTCGKFY